MFPILRTKQNEKNANYLNVDQNNGIIPNIVPNSKKDEVGMRKAFTLAEVLITLGIIGIVAAMTLPALIVNYQKQETVTKLKKAYAVMSEAVKFSEIQNGSTTEWDYNLPADEFFNRYLKDYLKSTSNVPLSEIKKRISYKYLNGDDADDAVGNSLSYVAKISDGMFVFVDGWTGGGYRGIEFDLNGYAKPNIIGRDVFYFAIKPKLGFTCDYANVDLVDITNPSLFQACVISQSGRLCSRKIISDGWQIKPDYPW